MDSFSDVSRIFKSLFASVQKRDPVHPPQVEMSSMGRKDESANDVPDVREDSSPPGECFDSVMSLNEVSPTVSSPPRLNSLSPSANTAAAAGNSSPAHKSGERMDQMAPQPASASMPTVAPEIRKMVDEIFGSIDDVFSPADYLYALRYMWGGPEAETNCLQDFHRQIDGCNRALNERTLNNASASRQFNAELMTRLVGKLPQTREIYAKQRENAERITSSQGGARNQEALKAEMLSWIAKAETRVEIDAMVECLFKDSESFSEQDFLLVLDCLWNRTSSSRKELIPFLDKVAECYRQLGLRGLNSKRDLSYFDEELKSRLVKGLSEDMQAAYAARLADAKYFATDKCSGTDLDLLEKLMAAWIRHVCRLACGKGETGVAPKDKSMSEQGQHVSQTSDMVASSAVARGDAPIKSKLGGVPAEVDLATLELCLTTTRAPVALQKEPHGPDAIARVASYLRMAFQIETKSWFASQKTFSREQLTMWPKHYRDCWSSLASVRTYAAMSGDTSRLIAARREVSDRDGTRLDLAGGHRNSQILGSRNNGYDNVAGADLPGNHVSIAARAPLYIPETDEVIKPLHLELGAITLSRRDIQGEARHYYENSGPNAGAFRKDAYRTSLQTRLGHIEKCAADNPGHEVVLFVDGFVEELRMMEDEDRALAMDVAAGDISNTVAALKQKGCKLYTAPAEVDKMNASSAIPGLVDRLSLAGLANDLWGRVHGKLGGSRVEHIGSAIPNKSIGDKTILVTLNSPRLLAGSCSSDARSAATQVLNRHRMLNIVHAMYCAAINSGITPAELSALSEE